MIATHCLLTCHISLTASKCGISASSDTQKTTKEELDEPFSFALEQGEDDEHLPSVRALANLPDGEDEEPTILVKQIIREAAASSDDFEDESLWLQDLPGLEDALCRAASLAEPDPDELESDFEQSGEPLVKAGDKDPEEQAKTADVEDKAKPNKSLFPGCGDVQTGASLTEEEVPVEGGHVHSIASLPELESLVHSVVPLDDMRDGSCASEEAKITRSDVRLDRIYTRGELEDDEETLLEMLPDANENNSAQMSLTEAEICWVAPTNQTDLQNGGCSMDLKVLAKSIIVAEKDESSVTEGTLSDEEEE